MHIHKYINDWIDKYINWCINNYRCLINARRKLFARAITVISHWIYGTSHRLVVAALGSTSKPLSLQESSQSVPFTKFEGGVQTRFITVHSGWKPRGLCSSLGFFFHVKHLMQHRWMPEDKAEFHLDRDIGGDWSVSHGSTKLQLGFALFTAETCWGVHLLRHPVLDLLLKGPQFKATIQSQCGAAGSNISRLTLTLPTMVLSYLSLWWELYMHSAIRQRRGA